MHRRVQSNKGKPSFVAGLYHSKRTLYNVILCSFTFLKKVPFLLWLLRQIGWLGSSSLQLWLVYRGTGNGGKDISGRSGIFILASFCFVVLQCWRPFMTLQVWLILIRKWTFWLFLTNINDLFIPATKIQWNKSKRQRLLEEMAWLHFANY